MDVNKTAKLHEEMVNFFINTMYKYFKTYKWMKCTPNDTLNGVLYVYKRILMFQSQVSFN